MCGVEKVTVHTADRHFPLKSKLFLCVLWYSSVALVRL